MTDRARVHASSARGYAATVEVGPLVETRELHNAERAAADFMYQAEHVLAPADATVYATVMDHLARSEHQEQKFFANRDRGDFGSPAIGQQLAGRNCELFFSFAAARGFLRR